MSGSRACTEKGPRTTPVLVEHASLWVTVMGKELPGPCLHHSLLRRPSRHQPDLAYAAAPTAARRDQDNLLPAAQWQVVDPGGGRERRDRVGFSRSRALPRWGAPGLGPIGRPSDTDDPQANPTLQVMHCAIRGSLILNEGTGKSLYLVPGFGAQPAQSVVDIVAVTGTFYEDRRFCLQGICRHPLKRGASPKHRYERRGN